MSVMETVLGIGSIIALVLLYFLAKMDNIIGKIFRLFWNFWFRILSMIPLLGWTSRFIITMNEKDEIEKEKFREEAAVIREQNARQFSEYAERKAAETAESEAKWKAQQQQKQQEDQEWIRKQAWKKDGRTDVEFSKDGTRWKYQNESWDNSRHI